MWGSGFVGLGYVWFGGTKSADILQRDACLEGIISKCSCAVVLYTRNNSDRNTHDFPVAFTQQTSDLHALAVLPLVVFAVLQSHMVRKVTHSAPKRRMMAGNVLAVFAPMQLMQHCVVQL